MVGKRISLRALFRVETHVMPVRALKAWETEDSVPWVAVTGPGILIVLECAWRFSPGVAWDVFRSMLYWQNEDSENATPPEQ